MVDDSEVLVLGHLEYDILDDSCNDIAELEVVVLDDKLMVCDDELVDE